MESIRILSNFNFQWTKTLIYQNNVNNIAIFFTFFQELYRCNLSYLDCNKTKENFSWEPEKTNVKFHKMTALHMKCSEFTCVFTILVKFDIYFLVLP